MTLTFQFTPEMKRMWPALSDDRPSPEWVKMPDGGFYVLHLNFPDHSAAMEMPGAAPGILPPYQERPKIYPLQFVLHFDPAHDPSILEGGSAIRNLPPRNQPGRVTSSPTCLRSRL
jgi:hypothetical protein